MGFINENVQYNKNVVIDTMKKCSNDVDIVIFGEAFLQGFYGATFEIEHDKALAIVQNDLIINEICSVAKEYGIAVSFGFIEKAEDCFYSSQITIDSNGNIIDLYRRVSPGWKEKFATEQYREGNGFHIFSYMGKKIIVGLCGDFWFDENINEAKQLFPDIVFLDIEMPGMSGIQLAEKMVEKNPDCKIIFCTSYAQYALDAIQLHIGGYMGYLLKPITKEALEEEIRYIKGKLPISYEIRVKCFGHFEVFYKGEPIRFKRSKTKELFAFLIDKNGAGVTVRQICARLWDDDSNDKKNANYVYQLFDDLRATLSTIGAEDLLLKKGYFYSFDPLKVSCDFYEYMQTGKPEFYGEYMTQYSWAEETTAMLERIHATI